MEMHERIKELRKDYLHLSQTDFGSKLGVSRSVINNIERNVLAKPEQKLSLIKLICKEFSVNEEWLLNGTEPMFVQADTFSLDEFVRQNGGSEMDLEILKTYFELDPDTRQALFKFFKGSLQSASDTETERLEEEYKKNVLSSAQKTSSSASSITNDTSAEKKAANEN